MGPVRPGEAGEVNQGKRANMTKDQAEAFWNWANTITSEVQHLMTECGRVASAQQLSEAMRDLNDATECPNNPKPTTTKGEQNEHHKLQTKHHGDSEL
jgi:hypothetical protein